MKLPGEGPQKLQERLTLTGKMGERIRGMMGDLDEKEWENVRKGIHALREQIDKMERFSFGPNSVSALKNNKRWTELVLVPKDFEHEAELEHTLSYLRIYPWKETRGNVQALVIENPRDMLLLREMLLFEFLRDRMKGEGREEEMEEWIDKKKRARLEEEEAHKAEEREYMLSLERDTGSYANKKRERELRVVEYLQSLPIPDSGFEAPVALERSKFHQFGYPRVASVGRSASLPRSKETAPPVSGEEVPDLTEETRDILTAFDEGRINEDALEKDLVEASTVRGTKMPNLALFPRKYDWVSPDGKKRKALRERATGRFLTYEEELAQVDIAQAGISEDATEDEREKAFTAVREIALMHRGLILYVMREVLKRNGSADPDELFQAGLKALFRSLQLHDKEKGYKFASYLVPTLEGYMRRIATETKYREMHVPVHRSQSRARYHEATEALRSKNPDKAVDEQEILRTLVGQGISSESPRSFDNFVRLAYLNYEKVGLDALEEVALHDVDLRGESVFASPEGSARVDEQEFKEALTQMLLHLTPREERVVRSYNGLGEERDTVADDVYAEVGRKFLPGLSIREVKKYIHDLGANGPLMDDKVFHQLSLQDQKIVANYSAFLEKRAVDESYESIAVRFGITRERIRQIEAKGLRKLKHPARSRLIRHFIHEESLDTWRKRDGKIPQIYKQGWVTPPLPKNKEEKKK